MCNTDGHCAKGAGIGSGIISHRLKSGEIKRALCAYTGGEFTISFMRLKSNLAIHFEDEVATVVTKRDSGSSQMVIEANLDENLFKF